MHNMEEVTLNLLSRDQKIEGYKQYRRACRNRHLLQDVRPQQLQRVRERAQDVNNPNVCVCLCCGTWMEGGKNTGRDVIKAIKGSFAIRKIAEAPQRERAWRSCGDLRREPIQEHEEGHADVRCV